MKIRNEKANCSNCAYCTGNIANVEFYCHKNSTIAHTALVHKLKSYGWEKGNENFVCGEHPEFLIKGKK